MVFFSSKYGEIEWEMSQHISCYVGDADDAVCTIFTHTELMRKLIKTRDIRAIRILSSIIFFVEARTDKHAGQGNRLPLPSN